MALDAHMEDYLRLSLHYAATSTVANPFEAAQAATVFANRYRKDRDKLEQTDADRAFGLAIQAADLIDYQLPFADELQGQELANKAHGILAEAVQLDPTCWDAQRMLAASEAASPNDYQHYLAQNKDKVEQACKRAYCHPTMHEPDMIDLEQQLALRPYLRWLAAEANIALMCGRYTICTHLAEEALALEEGDPADISFTLAIAYAKLEAEKSLARICAHHPQQNGSAWFDLAAMALAFKQGKLEAAHDCARKILETYPKAAPVLALQNDIPDGVYARIVVEPNSQDELILAVSEATILLQEGCDTHERGTLGSWLASLPELEGALPL